MKPISSVILIGSGNVARNLAASLIKSAVQIKGVWSRTKTHAQEMTVLTGSPVIEPESIQPHTADLVLICISDSAILEIAQRIQKGVRVAHSSGAFDQNDFGLSHMGVFYPLQTFTRSNLIDIQHVPILIEAKDQSFEDDLKEFALSLSSIVRESTASDRQKLHVSAVWINNFVNHMIFKAKEFSDNHDLEFELLKPLLKETVRKALEIGPFEAQTGPAIRNDRKTIQKHLDLLSDGDKDLYQAITNSIISTYSPK